MQQPNLIFLFVEKLAKTSLNYFVTGSIASTLYGEPRLTHDIDIVIELSEPDIALLQEIFPEDQYYVPPADILRLELKRGTRAHFNVINHDSGFKADFFIYKKDPLHTWAFENKKILLLESVQFYLAPAEYVIVRKLEYYREGGSEKHLRDIRSIVDSQGALIDTKVLDQFINDRNLKEQWQRALSFKV